MWLRNFMTTQLDYDKMNDKSTMPISEGLKEKKLKAPNLETAFVSDFQTYQAYQQVYLPYRAGA